MKDLTTDTLTTREALYIYFSLADSDTYTPSKTIRECYSIELLQLRSLADRRIAEVANYRLATDKIRDNNATFAKSHEQALNKQVHIAKLNLLEEDKLKWIDQLDRQDTFMLDRLLQNEIDRLLNKTSFTGMSMWDGIEINKKKWHQAKLEAARDDDQKSFLQYRSKFIIDNFLGNDKVYTVNMLEEIKKKVRNKCKVASWYAKEVDSSESVFTDWFQAYISKNSIPDNIPAFHTELPLQPHTSPFLPEFKTIKYDTDYWLFQFRINYDVHHHFLELYLRTMKGAWSQKKYRDSNNGKKACSFMLGEEQIKLLEKLCKKNRRKKNEMIEILIEDACEEDGLIKKPNRR